MKPKQMDFELKKEWEQWAFEENVREQAFKLENLRIANENTSTKRTKDFSLVKINLIRIYKSLILKARN